jgi:two-component system response regulator YesN
MLSTLIVDDELWVCKLVKGIVNWERLGFQIIGEANDGNQAFELIVKNKPDLVITDIRMPGTDGLALIKKVKEYGVDTSFIIISGYSDFSYAKEALKYGASGYLLKPIDKKELTDLLKIVQKGILDKMSDLTSQVQTQQRLEQSIKQLKDRFLVDLLHSDQRTADPADLEDINSRYRLDFKKGCFQILICRVDTKNALENEEVEAALLSSIEHFFLAELEAICFEVVAMNARNQLIFVLNYHPMKNNLVINAIPTIFRKISANLPLEGSFDLTIGCGSCESAFELAPKSFSLAKEAIQARVALGPNKIIDLSKLNYRASDMRDLFPLALEVKLRSSLEVFDSKAFSSIIGEIFRSLSGMRDIHPGSIFKVAYEIVESFYKVMRQVDIDLEKQLKSLGSVYEEIGECKSIDQIIDYFAKLFAKTLTSYNNLKQNHSRKVIELIKCFVFDNYGREITLNDISKVIQLNPKYIGELFKKETGINFSDFLTNHRIDMAKELLKDVRCRINEVSDKVGYKDVKYFSSLFKKNTGVTPAEYKKMFS